MYIYIHTHMHKCSFDRYRIQFWWWPKLFPQMLNTFYDFNYRKRFVNEWVCVCVSVQFRLVGQWVYHSHKISVHRYVWVQGIFPSLLFSPTESTHSIRDIYVMFSFQFELLVDFIFQFQFHFTFLLKLKEREKLSIL